jgi:hypothetical protein
LALLVNPMVNRPFADLVDDNLPVPRDAIWGVAKQYALNGMLQPSTAAVAAVAGVAVVLRQRAFLGLGLVMAAAVVHPSFFLPAAILVTALVVGELWEARDLAASVRRLAPGVALAAVVTVLWAVLNWSAINVLRGSQAEPAGDILLFRRVAAHGLPEEWFGIGAVVAFAVVAGAGLLGLRQRPEADRRTGRFLLVALALISVSVVLVYLADRPRLNLTFPWRASVVVVPVAAAWILGLAANAATNALRRNDGARTVLGVVAALAIAVSIGAGIEDTASSYDDRAAKSALVTELRARPTRGTGLIPTSLQDVRLSAELPVYVDYKSHPVEPADVVRWSARLNRANAAMDDPVMLCELVEAEQLGWVVVPRGSAESVRSECLSTWSERRAGSFAVFREP